MIRVTTRPVRVAEAATVDLPQSAEATFSFMWDPASSGELVDAEVAAALPGREGLGEIQAFVLPAPGGRVGLLHEVTELEPGRRAVTRGLGGWCPSGGALTVEALGPGSCRLTQEFWADLPAGVQAGMDQHLRGDFRQRLDLMMRRLSDWAAHRP